MSARALYLHIPFCRRKCSYCDFVSFEARPDDPLMAAYAKGLKGQVEEAVSLGLLEGGGTAYVGGGTPSFASDATVSLIECVSQTLNPYELTIEANPDSATLEFLSKVKDAGATRISMGVQSLDDWELRALGRVHGADTAIAALKRASDLGFSVSADLMCAIPHQTSESWNRTICGVLDCGVSHVSVYPLMIEEGTPFAAAVDEGRLAIPDDGDEANCMVEAEDLLVSRGFERYEVASYARAGHACAHNRAYWTGASYLGLGAAAASMFERPDFEALLSAFPQIGPIPDDAWRIRFTCTSDRHALAHHARLADQQYEVEFLIYREALAEDLMLGARMSCGPSPALVSRAREVMGAELDDCLAGLIDDGFLDGSLAPTRKGWLLGNELYGRLWDLAVPH